MKKLAILFAIMFLLAACDTPDCGCDVVEPVTTNEVIP